MPTAVAQSGPGVVRQTIPTESEFRANFKQINFATYPRYRHIPAFPL